MEGAGNAELPDKEHESTEHSGLPIDPGPKYGQARHMNQDEEDAGNGNVKTPMHKI
jgi:hypothetical protein